MSKATEKQAQVPGVVPDEIERLSAQLAEARRKISGLQTRSIKL